MRHNGFGRSAILLVLCAALVAAGVHSVSESATAQNPPPAQGAPGNSAPPAATTPPAAGSAKEAAASQAEPEAEVESGLASDQSTQNLIKKNPELTAAFDKLKQNDRAGTLKALKEVVANKPTLPPAELLLARFLLDNGNVARGMYELDGAAAAHPQDPGVYLSLAGLALAQGRFTEATLLLEKTEKLLASLPDSNPRKKSIQFIAHNHWATVHGRFERWADARDRLKEVLKMEPDNAMGHYRLAHSLFGLKEGQKGYAEFQAAYKQNKKLPTPPIAVVMYYQGANQPELADKWMDFAEKEFGQDGPTRLFLGTGQWQRGNISEAKRHAQAAAAATPDSPAVLFLQGVIAHYDGDLKTAEDKLEAAFKAAPSDFQVRDHLAKVLIQNANPDKRNRALALAQQTAQSAQNNRDAIATLAWVLYNSGQTESALQAMGIVTQGPISGDAAYFVGRVLIDRKQNDDARKLLESALENKPLFVHRRDAEKLLQQLKS
ncbi:MAG: tetratricopeptide repeat protein [Planctomycetes bacterium]|nr:tetratricopeptide repeat protein [Planctomycetota bacterium]